MTSRLFEQVKREAANAYPEECCGALLGRVRGSGGEKRVEEVYLLLNAKETERERRYLITPDQYRELEKRAEREDLQILGIYHSHPDHLAEPSPFDLEHAMPWWSYVIVSVENGQTNEVKSWLLQDDRSRFSLEEIRILQERNGE
ncbi:MAG: M67 family metallopeptidase [Deltaproteobacteria bacterium]|nr:M67 family metallopeptidase [Deltaproteobacteria bacterium]